MGLKFKVSWLRNPPPDGKFVNTEIPSDALREFRRLALQMARPGSRKSTLEHFKEFFCVAAGEPYGSSSSEGFAEYDLGLAMDSAAKNAPAFIDAFYSACTTLAERDDDYADDYAVIINDMCSEFNIGYVIDGPNLLLREDESRHKTIRKRVTVAVPKKVSSIAQPGEIKHHPEQNEPEAEHYDVALSFAGEDRDYAERLAQILRDHGVRVFYDRYEQATLWGKNLQEHLDKVYRQASRYVVMFVSEQYAQKVWTTHERRSAQAKALEATSEYILPVRLDDTEIPGLLKSIGHLDLRELSIEEVAEILLEKLRQK